MNRAYSTFELKSADEKTRRIAGIASTPTPDRMLDIVEPDGAVYKLPLPLLSQHDHHLPIGFIDVVDVSKKGIAVEGEIATDTGLDYIEVAWKQIKAKLVRGFSIGFKPIEYAWMDNGGIHFQKWDFYELSAVTIPANQEAVITTIKAYDQDPSLRSQVLNATSGVHPAIARALALRKRLGL